MAYKEEIYVCTDCPHEVDHQMDCYTGAHWVKCRNKDCTEFDKVKTYVDIELYRKKL
jgi:hypothetical protein